ncbi:hypothetical protein lerEdw1_002123 [Lerista edwardsae]|nr:hypothetical protein lerEdw1_002123 [Lerista edwardsae]
MMMMMMMMMMMIIFFMYSTASKRDCIEKFGLKTVERIAKDDDAICTTEYSRIVPLENGEIVVSLVNGRPGAMNFSYSPLLRNFTKATNIRLRFLQTNTLLGHLMGKALRDPTVTRRYYYSIKDISIGGRCVCHGHADVCDAKDPTDPYRLHCDCQHNTCGGSCDRCCPGFNQKPWKPATTDSANECEACHCNGHAYDCYYDPEVDRHKASQNRDGQFEGGGVCIDCQVAVVTRTSRMAPVKISLAAVTASQITQGSTVTPVRMVTSTSHTAILASALALATTTAHATVRLASACVGLDLKATHVISVPLATSAILSVNFAAAVLMGHCQKAVMPLGDATVGLSMPGLTVTSAALDIIPTLIAKKVEKLSFAGQSWHIQLPVFKRTDMKPAPVTPGALWTMTAAQLVSANATQITWATHATSARQASMGIPPVQLATVPQKALSMTPVIRRLGNVAVVPEWLDCVVTLAFQEHMDFRNVKWALVILQDLQMQTPPCRWVLVNAGHMWKAKLVIGCQCQTVGTIAGVAECQQADGRCFCKPNVCGQFCSTCSEGYYNLESGNYFGCQGASSFLYDRMFRLAIGPTKGHYIPDLHHHKYELEEGTTLDGRPVRFGYNPLEFENFSWRGYTQMSPIQNKVKVTVHVREAELYVFHVILRYINSGAATVYGKITAYQPRRKGTDQTKQIVFAPTKEPAFVTVPQNSFGEPFVLSPHVWSLIIEAEGILLDYLVLLPSSYYEAPILQLKVSDPCTCSPSTEQAGNNCLLYQCLPVEQFPFASGEDAVCKLDNSLPRPCPKTQIIPTYPEMVLCSGSEVEMQLQIVIPQPGRYAVLVEYVNIDAPQVVGVAVSSPQLAVQQGTLALYTCKYSFLCRGIVLDSLNRLAAFELATEATIQFTADQAHFFLYKVYLVPYEQFTLEYVEPKVHCISVHGAFSPNSSSCVPSRYQKISQSVVLEEGQLLPVAPGFPLIHAFSIPPAGVLPASPVRPPTLMDSSAELILLQAPQTTIVLSGRIQSLGSYAFILHYYQPSHPTFPVEVLINGGRIWQGQTNATFCPHGYGCRSLVVSENQIVLDVTDNDLHVIIRVPEGQRLWLDYILVVPEGSYGSSYLSEEPLDKSYDFISNCGVNGFYINPATSSKFCQDSAISISLFYNNGAQPCRCHEAGAIRSQCEPFGGQCACKPNIIGQECSRSCDCGPRLCEELTGQCICPPRTIKPECTVCEPQTFGCHPLIGCEDCNCSRAGIQDLMEPGCNEDSGQCRCKPNIVGRQCDLCAPGYYGYPNCRSCDCHQAGTKPSVCDPVTGQCHCKENVEGPRCDQCHLGTFSLEASNPKGCTSCFCFGATDRCHSAEKYRMEFVDMNDWILLSGDRQRVPTMVSLEAEIVRADLRNFPEAFQELYWHAPSSYLGDQISSYGGFLRYELHSDPRRGDVFVPMESRPDVILKGNQMSIMFLESTYPILGEVYEGRLQLVEDNFRHTETHNPVSREELMMVLSKLEQLQIRALYSQISSSVSLYRVVLETATEAGGGIPATNVELCMCPANYRGDSCQECAPGFAIGCVHKGSTTQCLCKPGYAGVSCERCAPGYYGNPLVIGSFCQPCDCSGNADPNMLFSDCDSLTGFCTGCMHNTAGPRCEVCEPGFYGDAVLAKNCIECACESCGTESCDPRTGQCHCKPGVTGHRCDRCQEGYYGYEACSGCQRCDCDIGSVSLDCHSQNGHCRCSPGVSGSRCQQCSPGYWGLSKNGCSTCDSCVLLLLEDLQKIESSFPALRHQLTSLNATSIAWSRLHSINGSMQAMTATMTNRKANQVTHSTEESHRRAESHILDIGKIRNKIDDLTYQMGVFAAANASTTSTEEFRQKLAEVEAMLRHMKAVDFSFQRATAVEENNEAQKLLDRVKTEFFSKLDSNQGIVNQINDQLDQFSSKLMDLRDALNEAVNKTRQAEDLNSLYRNHLEETQQKSKELQEQYGLVQDTLNMAEDHLAQVSDFLKIIQNAKEESEKLAAKLDGARYPLSDKAKEYSRASGKIPIVEEAEDHARLLDELARNLSRQLLGVRKLPGSSADCLFERTTERQAFGPVSHDSSWSLPELLANTFAFLHLSPPNSIIHGTNQDGFIQRAINASNAYASIIAAVKDAESAANEANRAASEALTNVALDDLGTRSEEMKRNSSAIEEAVKREQQKLNAEIKRALQAAKDKLADTQAKKEQLRNQLQSVKSTLDLVQDGTAEAIQNAKDVAAKANETAARMAGRLDDMRRNLDAWKEEYGDLESEDLNQAVQDAKNTVSSLESTIPLLLGKLSSLENRRSHNATVSDNILRVRQLISLARNAVSKIRVPVKFNGTSGVQVRTPSNLQDLAAYTSLKFYIQSPEPKVRQRRQSGDDTGRFVLYLGHKDATGDYMGIILKDHKVQWVYRLGDEEPTQLMVDEEIGEQFATVSINRILQYGHMSVTVEKQTLHETKGDSVAKGEQGLFNFKPHNVVLYVGGYPSSFKPPAPLQYPGYQGCIEMDSLNEEVVSLYNFQRTFHLDTTAERPCTRSKSTGDPWLTDGSYFDGTGYAEITFETQIGIMKRFEQEMRLVSYNGIIFFLKYQARTPLNCHLRFLWKARGGGREWDQMLCLAVEEGKLVLYYDFNGGLKMASPSKDSANLIVSRNTNKAIQIILFKIGTKDRVLVRLEQSTILMVEQQNSLQNATSYYLGGVPESVLPESLKKIFPKGGSIRGCMKGLKALGKYVDLKRMNTTGVSYGCTLDLLVARSVKFHGHGYLTLSLRSVPSLQDFYTGFSFRTSQSQGLMYHHATEEGVCQVSLQDGRVAVKVLTAELSTKNAYADDLSHYVAIYSDAAGIRLYVDDQLQGTKPGADRARRQKRQDEPALFRLGGTPSTSEVGNLTGCIGNVFVRRKSDPQVVVDLQQSTESVNVTINCPRDRQPQQMRAPEKRGRWKPKVTGKKVLKDVNCQLSRYPKAVKDAFQFGGSSASHLEFSDIPATFQERFHFSMEIKLNSSKGLLLYMANESQGSFLSLFISSGRLVLLADISGNKLRLRSKDKYHDGRWHTVFCSRDRNRVQLVIDGLRAQESFLSTAVDVWNPGPVYVGGAPAGKAKAHIPDASASSFNGCLRHLKLDRKPLDSPSNVVGVTPCYVGPLESGVYFSAEGGSVSLDRFVAIGQDLELMLEVRPRSTSGLIFHIGSRRTNYLRLYTDNQKVTVIANTGAGEFSTFVAQPSLCDGQWHTIAVIKGGNVIQLDVDTEGNYTVGPNQAHTAAIRESFHLGGMPEGTSGGLTSSLHLAHPPYVGCMKNLVINRTPINLRQAGTVRGAVGLKGCPVM